MFLYKNLFCPVCEKEFTPEEDIVSCPFCATPHHRECYNSIGHCKNRPLHSQGFVYKRSENIMQEQSEAEEKKADSKPFVSDISELFAAAKAPYADFKSGAESFEGNEKPYSGTAPGETISGVSVSDMISVVGLSYEKFINKFRKGKKLGWNWAAFFFGPFYYLFRKMYKEGILFLCLQTAIRLLVSVVYQEQLTSYLKAAMAMESAQSLSGYYEQIVQSVRLAMSTGAYVPLLISGITLMVFSIVLAAFADWFYKKTVVGIIDKTDEKLREDSSLLAGGFVGMSGEPLDERGVRKLFLNSKGGTSIFAPSAAFFIISFITGLI